MGLCLDVIGINVIRGVGHEVVGADRIRVPFGRLRNGCSHHGDIPQPYCFRRHSTGLEQFLGLSAEIFELYCSFLQPFWLTYNPYQVPYGLADSASVLSLCTLGRDATTPLLTRSNGTDYMLRI